MDELENSYFVDNHNDNMEIKKLNMDDENVLKIGDRLCQQKCKQCCSDNVVMRKQVSMLVKERDSLNVLWQTSQKAVEALEDELKTYQRCHQAHRHQTLPNEELRPLELRLETSLNDYLDLERKYKVLVSTNQSLENQLRDKEKQIKVFKEKEKALEAKLNKATTEFDEVKIDLAATKKNNEDLNSQLARSQKETVSLAELAMEAKSKVSEALQLFDLVSAQKNELVDKLNNITNELEKTKAQLDNANQEASAVFHKELDEIKDKYNEKISDMLQHIRNLDTELTEKGTLLSNLMRENKILQKTVDELMEQNKNNEKAVHPKVAMAEQQLEDMFQQVLKLEKRKMILTSQRQALAMELQRAQDDHERELKRRGWEEQLLRTQCDEQALQIEHLQKSLEETHEMITKLQLMLNSKTDLNHKVLLTKEEQLKELDKHLKNQMQLNQKWKKSYVEMTKKLKDKLQRLQEENEMLRIKKLHSLKGENKDLVTKLDASDSPSNDSP